MKESVTKFDFESAFKALDEIDIPVADKGIKANRPALTEIFSRKSKFDSLFEEYYDIGSAEGLDDAKAAREAEIAKAKLDRIEKIVDLDADSPEDLLTSYVGKYIMQCPQCMTLFYKDKEDVVESEDDPSTVNVNEVCQHCGNESGYTLVGKVGEAEAEETAELPTEEPAEALDLDIPDTEDSSEEVPAEDDMEIDLDAINLEDEPVEEEEKTEEAFTAHTSETLVEEVQEDKDIKDKLDAHNEYIEYLISVKTQEEEALEKATNEQVKAAIQRRIDALTADIDAALPEEVKSELAAEEAPIEEVEEATTEEAQAEVEEISVEAEEATEEVTESLTEALHEEADLEVSADEFEELINSPEFKKPISDTAARAMINAEKEEESEAVEESLTENKLTRAFKFMTRTDKADYILANAMVDANKAKFNDKNELVPDANNKRFSNYIVIGYKNKFSSGKTIVQAPDFDNKDLEPGAKPKFGDKYAQADTTAKGWSMRAGNGPAFIYLAKNAKGDDAIFLCQYFEGKLYNDNVDKYFNIVKKDLEGASKEAKGKMREVEDDSAEKPAEEPIKTKEIKASEVKVGMKVKVENDALEVIQAKSAKVSKATIIVIVVKTAEGSEQVLPFTPDAKVVIIENEAPTAESFVVNKGLATLVEQLEDLQEASLEKFISDSLIEAYGNVAGYRLASCEYLNEKLNVNGTIYFTSGKTRKTTYSFSEAYVEEDKIKLTGLNEKLGLDKKFALTGRIENKTFITESFSNK